VRPVDLSLTASQLISGTRSAFVVFNVNNDLYFCSAVLKVKCAWRMLVIFLIFNCLDRYVLNNRVTIWHFSLQTSSATFKSVKRQNLVHPGIFCPLYFLDKSCCVMYVVVAGLQTIKWTLPCHIFYVEQ